jgi:transposase-like protein
MSMAQPLSDHVNGLVRDHGSIRSAAKAVGIHHSYLFRMLTGEKTHPSDLTLNKLGLLSTPLYCRIKP